MVYCSLGNPLTLSLTPPFCLSLLDLFDDALQGPSPYHITRRCLNTCAHTLFTLFSICIFPCSFATVFAFPMRQFEAVD